MNRSEKGRFIKGNTGKPKGAKNKFTNLKQSFLDAFVDLGGTEGLKKWASNPKNMKDFLYMLARMLPKDVQLAGKGDGPITIMQMIKDVNRKSADKV